MKNMEGNSLKLISKYRTQIMGFAALWIFIFHSWFVVSEQYSMIWRAEYFIKKTGFVGVDILYFVSGLGLVYAIEKYSLKDFYIRRLINVYTVFLVTGLCLWYIRGWDLKEFLSNILCIKFYTVTVYQMLWTVPAILTFYLLFPLYYKFFKKAENKTLFTVAVCMIWLALTILSIDKMRIDLYGFTNRIPIFLAGILVGYYIREEDIVFTKQGWIFIVTGFLLGIYLSYYTNIKDQGFMVPVSNCCVPNFLMTIFGCIILSKIFWIMDTHWKTIGKGILNLLKIMGIASLEIYAAQDICDMGYNMRPIPGINNLFVENLIIFAIIFMVAVVVYMVCKVIKNSLRKLLGY